jgi:hypothetical protein
MTELSEPLWSGVGTAEWTELCLPLVRLLFDIGFLGIRPSGSRTQYSYASSGHGDAYLRMTPQTLFYVHPTFLRHFKSTRTARTRLLCRPRDCPLASSGRGRLLTWRDSQSASRTTTPRARTQTASVHRASRPSKSAGRRTRGEPRPQHDYRSCPAGPPGVGRRPETCDPPNSPPDGSSVSAIGPMLAWLEPTHIEGSTRNGRRW